MKTCKTPILEPATQQFLDAVAAQGGEPTETLSIAEARKRLEDMQSGEVTKHDVDVEDRILPVGPAGAVSVAIYKPRNVTGRLPVAMYFHGGGWVLGSKHTHNRLVRDLVHGARAAFVFVNYSRSPEVRHPIAIEEVYAATEYVAKHGSNLGLDSSRMAVIGDSVGGTMAAAVPLLAKERGGPRIAYQVLLYPVTDSSMSQDSFIEYAEGPWLTRRRMEWFWDLYAPDKNQRDEVSASPLLAVYDRLRDLPPALVIVAEYDILRDEGEAYAKKLSLAGVDVTAVRYLATIHSFMTLNALADTPAAKSAIELASLKLRAAFGE